MTDPTGSLTVQCSYCGTKLALNEDSAEARAAGTDPHQQLRKHIFERHAPNEIVQHHHNTAWLIDMLFFRAPLQPERWKANIIRMLDHYMNQ